MRPAALARAVALAAVLMCLIQFAVADVYLHNPRGSNDRLNENTENRDNDNRLFDSQDNDRGGYNVGDDFATAGEQASGGGIMQFYSGSMLYIEWTNQHGCGVNHPNVRCDLILQYMCEDTASNNALWNSGQNSPMRDGTTTSTIQVNNPDDLTRGRQEPVDWYQQCNTRERNMGLFVADQTPDNTQGASATRQNPTADRYGFECQEERDYYPYWHPTPWKDIAVLTWNTSLCSYFTTYSNNVYQYGQCSVAAYNNPTDCAANGGNWQTYSNNLPAPDCQPAPWSRDNHLGNGVSAAYPDSYVPETNRYLWTVPSVQSSTNCVLRLRYNVSTGDYWGYSVGDFTDWRFNATQKPDISPISTDPIVNIGIQQGLQLAVNTAQYGRTFQDRTHLLTINPAPSGTGTIWNLNIRGRKGNIVDCYPAVEYDFVPNNLTIGSGDSLHIQWTGSTTTPGGEDKNNMVQIAAINVNYPLNFSNVTMFSTQTAVALASAGATGPFDSELADRPCYYNGGLVQFQGGTYYYMCTVNNDFSNRSQKGRLVVT